MKTLLTVAVLLAATAVTPAVGAAAPEPEMSQAQADAIANAVADDTKSPVNAAGCDKPMRDGRCPPVASNRQFVAFGPPTAGATAGKTTSATRSYAKASAPKAMELAINFLVGSAQLTEASKRSLDRLAASFTKASVAASQFFVDGHTDKSGACEANLKLSQDRASAAVDYLASAGVDRARMTPRGFGFQDLKSPANPTSGVNRRVEVVAKKPATERPLPSC